ncbi:unnamed protein product [Wuchereria bancrofti]|uniref:Ion transport domain-containing protein n=1 Tax=Wuchereria bancrofti TaxID=6293 RepID=A0A3P7E457_WUCBA|nr:unnamed protein product [Wuchereria bancrofti]
MISSSSVFFIISSIISFVLKTHPSFQIPSITVSYNTEIGTDGTQSIATFKQCTSVHPIIRVIFAPSLQRFFKSPITVVDLLATGSFYLDWLVTSIISDQSSSDSIDFLSILCVLRLFKLTQHFSGLKILIQTFKAQFKTIVIFAALVYYAERIENNPENQFTSIPAGLWWAIVTMCTIGFGDMVPKTYLGMLVGSLCALMGVLTIALPVPVIVANFSNLYSHSQARAKLPKKRRRVLQAHEIKTSLIFSKSMKKSQLEGKSLTFTQLNVTENQSQIPWSETYGHSSNNFCLKKKLDDCPVMMMMD